MAARNIPEGFAVDDTGNVVPVEDLTTPDGWYRRANGELAEIPEINQRLATRPQRPDPLTTDHAVYAAAEARYREEMAAYEAEKPS